MNAPMNSPLRGRPLAIALTALIVLLLSLLAPTGFEWPAAAVGLLSAIAFWFQCDEYEEEA